MCGRLDTIDPSLFFEGSNRIRGDRGESNYGFARCQYPQKSTLGLFLVTGPTIARNCAPFGMLAERLTAHGLEESETGIASKMARGTFSATFFVVCLADLEKDGLKFEEIFNAQGNAMIKNWGAALAFLALLGLVAFASWREISVPHDYRYNTANQSGYAANNKNQATDYIATARAVGAFLHDHEGPINAVSSAVIAIFTVVLALTTRGLHLATRGLQDFARIQADDMKESIAAGNRFADASTESNKISRELFFSEQRPWIDVSIETRGSVIIHSKGAHIDIWIVPRNLGKTPALKTNAFAKMFCVNTSQSVEDAFADFCEQFRAKVVHRPLQIGYTIFPNHERRLEGRASCDRAHIDTARHGDFIYPCIFVCARYFYEGSDIAHRTAFIIDLQNADHSSGFKVPADGADAINIQVINDFRRMAFHDLVD